MGESDSFDNIKILRVSVACWKTLGRILNFYFLLPLMHIVTFSTAAIVRQSAGLQQMAILNPDTKLLPAVFLAIMVLSTMEAMTWPY